jgi:hypothetical protein
MNLKSLLSSRTNFMARRSSFENSPSEKCSFKLAYEPANKRWEGKGKYSCLDKEKGLAMNSQILNRTKKRNRETILRQMDLGLKKRSPLMIGTNHMLLLDPVWEQEIQLSCRPSMKPTNRDATETSIRS